MGTSAVPVWGSAGVDALVKRGPWDTFIVGAITMPGVASVTGEGVGHDIEVKKSKGSDGATFTDHGRQLAKFRVKLILSTQGEFDAFLAARKVLQATNKTGKLLPQQVTHPALNVVGISSAYCSRVGFPKPSATRGAFEVDLEWVEFRLPTSVAKGSGTPGKDVKAWNKPNTPQSLIESVNGQIKAAREMSRLAKTPAEQTAALKAMGKAVKSMTQARSLLASRPPSVTSIKP